MSEQIFISLGIILYEMLTGVDPFGFDLGKVTGSSWFSAHLLKPPQPLRSQPGCEHLSSQLEAVVMRCLEKSPEARFPSAQTLSQALQAAILIPAVPTQPSVPAPVPVIVTPQLSTAPEIPPRQTRRKFLTILSFSGVGLGGVLVWKAVSLLLPRPEPAPSRELTGLQRSPSSSSSTVNKPTLQSFSFAVVTVNAQGKISDRRQRQGQYFTEDLGNGIFLEMVAIPGGTFSIGSPGGEQGRDEHEGPQHSVTIAAFYMNKFTVTQAQWRLVSTLPKVNQKLNSEPFTFKGDNRPVENVSWVDAQEFCARLHQKTGRNYQLPGEAQWEYACRAGTTTPFHFGKTIATDLANYDGALAYSSESKGIWRHQTTPVGSFQVANNFGLYDMHGNVWEWCADSWHENYSGAPTDGSAWITGEDSKYRLLRGGSWGNSPKRCRSAARFTSSREGLNYRGSDVGFRVICSIVS